MIAAAMLYTVLAATLFSFAAVLGERSLVYTLVAMAAWLRLRRRARGWEQARLEDIEATGSVNLVIDPVPAKRVSIAYAWLRSGAVLSETTSANSSD